MSQAYVDKDGRPIRFYWLNHTNYLEKITNEVYILSKNYNFYFNGHHCNHQERLDKLLLKTNNTTTHCVRHYYDTDDGESAFVIYTKNKITAYIDTSRELSIRTIVYINKLLNKKYELGKEESEAYELAHPFNFKEFNYEDQ